MPFIIVISVLFVLIFLLWKKKRPGKNILKNPFSEKWKMILREWVGFYNQLNATEKVQFEYRVQQFLATTTITGIKTSIDDTDRILIAASAIIPVFSFPEWQYRNLKEVLIYPTAFNEKFQWNSPEKNITGMVGTGYMEGKMILSKTALRQGFRNEKDKKNVGIHEFTHLVDKADGMVDGIPELLLKKQYVLPWINLVKEKMKEIHHSKSDINPYGGVAESEFFPVITEYFFERPRFLKRKHPLLYSQLQDIFTVDLAKKYKIEKTSGQTHRNDPCPCGSGEKFKRCCRKT